MKGPTREEAIYALLRYVPGDQIGTPASRRINAMRDAINAFLKLRGELTDSNDQEAK